jgi:hypothetical protein
MRQVYLSGGMEYAHDEGRSWRSALQEWFEREGEWTVFNPNAESMRLLREEFAGADLRAMKPRDPARYRSIVSRIVLHDAREIAERSDLVVCLWDEAAARGAGTKGELTIARYFGKPVYMVTAVPQTEIPGWVLGCVTEIFPDFESLQSFLRRRPAP